MPASSLAILSRWRDRRFGYWPRLLPDLVNTLVEHGRLPAATNVVLAGVDAHWDRVGDLKRFLESEPKAARRTIGAEIAYRYIRVQPYSAKAWAELTALATSHSLELPDLDRVSAGAPDEAPTAEPGDSYTAGKLAQERRTPDWDAVFDKVDLAKSEALCAAYESLRTYDPPYEFDEFFRQACARAAPGRAADLVRALLGWSDFGMHELRHFLGNYPVAWRAQLSFKAALRDLVLKVCTREPYRVFRRSWYRPIPFDELAADGIVSDAEVVDATLAGFVDRADHLGASELFHMTEALAAKLAPPEAEEALEFGLDLLQEVLRNEDSDGPWRTELAPPQDVTTALAGYIWAGLASPVVAERWQYAHVIREIVEFGWDELLAAMLVHAERADGGPFGAEGLPFYSWHARQWLLIGLARGAQEHPAQAAVTVPLLLASLRENHVVIRALAAMGLRSLQAAGLPSAMDVDLTAVNRPALPPKVFDSWMNFDDIRAEPAPQETLPEDEKYYFGIDIVPYWFGPLGRAFGISETSLERRARRLLKLRMNWSGGGWAADPRHARNVFNDGETSHSHGSMPKVDDLTAYHGYHAMMLIAAELLEEVPPRRYVDDDHDAFTEWLGDHLFTRPDGRWLADRRDPRILMPPARPSGYGDATWPWAVTRDDLDRQLVTPEGRTVLWGHWTNGGDDAYEAISVRSALVSRPTAEALVAALQTASDPTAFGLPSLDSHHDLTFSAGRLVGWVQDDGTEHRLEVGDPWSEALPFPGPQLGTEFAGRLKATVRDPDGRTFGCVGGGTLRSELWTQVEGIGREASPVPGRRLSADAKALAAVHRLWPDQHLVFSVDIQRQPPKYVQAKGKFVDYPWPYCRYYLLGPNGDLSPL